MAEATLAEIALIPKYSIAKAIALVDKAKAQDPENPNVLIDRAGLMQAVGRMSDGINDSARAAELDPLSPNSRTNYISTLAYGGRIDAARAELARATQLWPGTQTIRQAEYALELRFGDFEKAMRSPESDFCPGAPLYIKARRSPTDANVKTLLDFLVRGFGSDSANFATRASFFVQAMGELNRPGPRPISFDRPVRSIRRPVHPFLRRRRPRPPRQSRFLSSRCLRRGGSA